MLNWDKIDSEEAVVLDSVHYMLGSTYARSIALSDNPRWVPFPEEAFERLPKQVAIWQTRQYVVYRQLGLSANLSGLSSGTLIARWSVVNTILDAMVGDLFWLT